MNERLSAFIDAIPSTIWAAIFTIVIGGLGWSIKSQFDQDRQIAALIVTADRNAKEISELRARQDMIILYLNPHSQPPQ